MTRPKATVLEIEKFNDEPQDKFYAKIKFKDRFKMNLIY